MGKCPAWADIKDRFKPDGSLRDVYVLKTTRNDWQKFIAFIASSPVSPVMTRGDQRISLELPADFPDYSVNAIMPMLKFEIAGILFVCHFFANDEVIEFDIDPNDVKDEYKYEALLSFLSQLRDVINRDVILTEENCCPSYGDYPADVVILHLAVDKGSN